MRPSELVDPIDFCQASLLRDLAELDTQNEMKRGYRSLLLKSAMESIDYLERAGGGSLGLHSLERLRATMHAELERLAQC